MSTANENFTDEPAIPATFQSLLSEFVDLEGERREHEERLKVIAEKAGKLSEELLNQFADLGLQNAKVKGLTVYVRMDRYVSKAQGVATETVCETLREIGCGYMVGDSYNAMSLKSKVREWIDQGIEVPPVLSKLLNIGEIPRLATRKA